MSVVNVFSFYTMNAISTRWTPKGASSTRAPVASKSWINRMMYFYLYTNVACFITDFWPHEGYKLESSRQTLIVPAGTVMYLKTPW